MKFWQSFTLTNGRQPYLTRRGVNTPWLGIYIHNIDAPDPGHDLHNHPWKFGTFILRGGYSEEFAYQVGIVRPTTTVPFFRVWNQRSFHVVNLDEAHRIYDVIPGTKTVVIRGRKVRPWGFYTPNGYVDEENYTPENRGLVKVEAK